MLHHRKDSSVQVVVLFKAMTKASTFTERTKEKRFVGAGEKRVAVSDGIGVASGDFILFQDADLEYDPDDCRFLVEPLLRLNADIVVGSRFIAP